MRYLIVQYPIDLLNGIGNYVLAPLGGGETFDVSIEEFVKKYQYITVQN